MGCGAVCLILLCGLIGCYAEPQCSMITPSVLRVDSEETIIVDGYGSTFNADVQIQDFPGKSYNYFQGSVSVNNDNGFLGTVKLTIPSARLEKTPNKKQFVYVIVRSPSCTLEKAVLVSFQSGYIFIQTDKTIYTPGSLVYGRIFQMDQNMNPEKKTVTYEILNPQKVVIKKESLRSQDASGIINVFYTISKLANLGVWTISAKYDGTDEQNYETNFEVKEYVLPSFEIKLEKTRDYFYWKDNEVNIKIFARYLYGKPVNGKAFVLFGIKRDTEEKVLTESLKRIPITRGEGTATLERENLMKAFEKEEEMLEWRLCLTVTVITDTGSDMLEAKLDDIYIVTSPYKILFTKTSKYFKPSMPYDYMVFVTNPDGSPAQGVPVTAESGKIAGTTQADGTVRLLVNSYSDTAQMAITVKTNDPKLTSDQQASATMIASAYNSAGGNYLHVTIEGGLLKPGDNPTVSFNLKNKDSKVQEQITHFTYVILNKGRIMKLGRQPRLPGQPLVNMKLPITPDFIPSFRFVAYYTVITDGRREIVSDSIWVDVTDSCMGTLELTPQQDKDKAIQQPGSAVNLNLRADHKAAVGLVVVDKGVFVLNSKYKISQSKVWESVEKHDIGCTPGSGYDNVGVFHDAGLVLHTSFELTTPGRQEPLCPAKPNRRRRSSAALIEYKDSTANKYTGLERTCCYDGMHVNPMGHSCERRSRLIQAGQECIAAFLDCCKQIEKKKASEKELNEDDELSRSDEDIEYVGDDDIQTRSEFPESWYWRIETMTEAPENGISTKSLSLDLKDSITTWEVLAVSLSANKGICVSEPYEIRVSTEFFIDLKLPYSVVRNEQVEIRAIIYNYINAKQKVHVEWYYNEAYCSPSTGKKRYREVVSIEAESSRAVNFVIVPLTVGDHYVELEAFSRYNKDNVRKTLKVVPEGRRKVETLKSVILQPEARREGEIQQVEIPAVNASLIVPNSYMQTILTLQGTPISELVGKSIDGIDLNHLIAAPGGCGEQNMMRMTPTVIATHYLDASGQWDRVGVERRALALQYIKQGVDGQMTYRKADASYSIFPQTPSSTWLTAYVVRVFALASKVINIDRDMLCGSVKWLMLEKQKPDGLFVEDAPVYDQQMVGGVTKGAKELESTLTAFVLIAMLESNDLCNQHIQNLRTSMDLAANFIFGEYQYLQKPYSIAITSYALARVGKLQNIEKLMSASTGNNHWEEPDSRQLSLEATSYALLALLTLKNSKEAGPLAQWLTEQRFHGEVYGSTQATIMLFQALAKYQLDVPAAKELEMDVTFRMPSRAASTTLRINKINAMQARSEEAEMNGEFTVTAKGPGKGTLTVFSVYYKIETEQEVKCNNFALSVTIRDEPIAKKPEDAKSTVSIEICTRFLGTSDATMSILDVSMMTGYAPSINDLKELQNRVDRYISRYEVKDAAFDRGALVIYLNKVSHTEEDCIKFNLYQYFEVGYIQPASVTVYDYYSPEKRCTKFYHVDEDSKLLGKICYGDVCRCAETNCFMQQQLDKVTAKARLDAACGASVDYVYDATLSNTEDRGNYDVHEMTVKKVIKAGTDEVVNGESRNFFSHRKCRQALQLKVGQDYLIWGVTKDLWNVNSKYNYMLTRDTWIERMPTNKECQRPENRNLCDDLYNFADELHFKGCVN